MTGNERAVLAHVVDDPDAWYARAVASFGEERAAGILAEKVGRWKPDYDEIVAFCSAPGQWHAQKVADLAAIVAAAGAVNEVGRQAIASAREALDATYDALRSRFLDPAAAVPVYKTRAQREAERQAQDAARKQAAADAARADAEAAKRVFRDAIAAEVERQLAARG